MSSLDELLSSAIKATLAPFLDEDICEYIQSTLAEDPNDEDARENVEELLRGSIDDETDPESVISEFFEKLNIANGGNEDGATSAAKKKEEVEPLQKLNKAVTMKEHDIQTFASGLSAEPMGGDHEDESISAIASFYANMIDITTEEVTSERKRRKDRQKATRLGMEDAERKRAIQEAADFFNDDDSKGDDDNPDDLLDAAADNSADVHIRNMDLPNLRGGGPDLLQSASLSLARGRRYGLMGRNGCGKTTFMSYLAQRQIEGAVPKKMTMLLVRQEIIGNEMSALETVIKSDVKREVSIEIELFLSNLCKITT
jgi:ATP-binding cassette subfamily F protein 3